MRRDLFGVHAGDGGQNGVYMGDHAAGYCCRHTILQQCINKPILAGD